jgi:hypothetical protein
MINACPIIPKEQNRIDNPKTVKANLSFMDIKGINCCLFTCPCGVIFKINYNNHPRLVNDLVKIMEKKQCL